VTTCQQKLYHNMYYRWVYHSKFIHSSSYFYRNFSYMVQNVCLRQFPIKCTLMLSILFKVLSSWHPNNNVFHIIFLCNLLYMQFIYAFFFLIKSISLYRKPKCLIYFMQILYVITLLFMDNILNLKYWPYTRSYLSTTIGSTLCCTCWLSSTCIPNIEF
jgi:hypothetical protein